MCDRIKLEWNDEDEANFQEMKEQMAHYNTLEKARDKYLAKYPNYSKCCYGWGYTSWMEYGKQFVDTCECVWSRCPRCGANNPVASIHPDEHNDDVIASKCASCSFVLYETEGLPIIG